jgi:HSP20 family protein
MTTLVRWDPRREAIAFRDAFGRMFDEPMDFRFPIKWMTEEFEPRIDFIEEENQYVVKASIPGVKPEDVEVTLHHNILTIRGEVNESKEVKEEKYHMRERRYGSFVRSVALPTEVRTDEIEAKHVDGVLTVRLPKSAVEPPKKITVQMRSQNGK